jgi:hypothetical protein
VICDRDKHTWTKVKNTVFHSANSAKEMEDYIYQKMGDAFAELAITTEDTINLAVGPETKPPGADSSNATLAVVILELTKEVSNLMKKVRNRGGGDGPGGGSGTAGDAGGETKKKKCKYCGRPHLEKTPEELCFDRP